MIQMDLTQRWTLRREAWASTAAPFDPRRCEVAVLDERPARTFVEAHHYSGTYPAARFRFGLYQDGELVGAAVYSHPTNDRTLTRVFPGPATASVELGRLVLLDGVAGNAESWFVARTFRALRQEGLVGVLSHSDPAPRRALDGAIVHPGHVGIVYQALGARYLGRATPRTLHALPSGLVLNDRSLQKVRAGERGWRSVAELLLAAGAPAYSEGRDRTDWLHEALAATTRTSRHPGNHRYAWGLDRAVRFDPNPEAYPCPPEGRVAPRWGRRAA